MYPEKKEGEIPEISSSFFFVKTNIKVQCNCMEDCIVTVKVIPKSSKNSAQLENGILRVHLNAPPVDGKANKALIQLLASIVHIPKSSIEIVRGEKGRNKQIKIKGLSESVFTQRLAEYNNT